jgi:hypothetical protein
MNQSFGEQLSAWTSSSPTTTRAKNDADEFSHQILQVLHVNKDEDYYSSLLVSPHVISKDR